MIYVEKDKSKYCKNNLDFIFILIFLSSQILTAQNTDSTATLKDKNDQSDTTFANQKATLDSTVDFSPIMLLKKSYFKQPTLPPLRISDKQKSLSIRVNNRHFWDPAEKINWDALNLPTNRLDYEINREYLQPLVPLTPLEVPQQNDVKPLTIHDIVIPTRQELDILEVLWLKEDVMDVSIYACLDSTLKITMEYLNRLLSEMTQKRLVRRELISPRFEFNAFGMMIEMSSQNRRNRIYSYHSNVDRELMRKFINANAYLFKEDSSIVNQHQLRAALKDQTLIEDLNHKIFQPQNR